MAGVKEIRFCRLDSLPKHLEDITKEIANHFNCRRAYVAQFCSMIKVSKRWKINNMSSKLTHWEETFSEIRGTGTIIDIVKRGFNSCRTNKEIDKLRGAMVEALVIGPHGGEGILSNVNYGWGARVDLHLPSGIFKVSYSCPQPQGVDCFRRSTVDFGYWNGRHGMFYECKAQPLGIGCKEVKYMQQLKSELASRNFSHEIFFVCAENRESVKMRLEEFQLSPVYKPWGIEDITNLMPA